MKRSKTSGEHIRELRESLKLSQSELGGRVGVKQGAVSAWERDDKLRRPSAIIYLKLAALARDAEEATWFLRKAEIDSDPIFRLVEKLGGGKVAHGGESDCFRIGPLPGTEGNGVLLLPWNAVPNPNFTYYAKRLPNQTWLALTPGLIVIDTKDAGDRLAPFWGDIIVVRSKRAFRGEPEHLVGKLHLLAPTAEGAGREITLPTAVLSGDQTPERFQGMTIGIHEHEFWKRDFAEDARANLEAAMEAFHAACQIAAQEMIALPGLDVVGKVIAWFPYQVDAQALAEAL